MRRRLLLLALAAAASLAAAPASRAGEPTSADPAAGDPASAEPGAADPTRPVTGVTAKDADAKLPVGGSVGLATSLGRGTFNSGPDHQPYVGLNLSMRPRWRVDRGLGMSLALRLDVDFNLVDNAYSDSTERQQAFLSDLLLTFVWDDFAKVEPAKLGFSGTFGLAFPTSLLSQHAGKVLGLQLGLSAEWAPLGWLTLTYSITGTKNFNRFDSAVLDDDDFRVQPLRRVGGPESVASGLTATGAGITAWALGNDLELSFAFLDDFSFTIGFGLLTAWSEHRSPKDAYSSRWAVGGTGRADIMTGSLALGWEPLDVLAVELGTVVEQAPRSEDNERIRFPFWDTSNGALNRQVFYLDVTLTL